MLKYVFIPGLQYERESNEAMARREAAMTENNRRVDALYEDWKRQRLTPMPSMIAWARQRGLLEFGASLVLGAWCLELS